jgi:GNAT superfamily N-acetyltransferase
VLTAHALAPQQDPPPARALAPEAAAILDVPAGYGGRGAWLDAADAPALARLLTHCRHEVALALGGAGPCEALRLLREGVPGTPGAAPRDRLAVGLFDGAGEMRAFVEVVRQHPERGGFCISALVVHPDLRCCGVAGDIVDAVERWARAEGARALHLHVPRRNAGAVAFALRSGFALAPDPRVGGAPRDARLALMSRRIA